MTERFTPGDRAAAMWAVQNTISRHDFLHAAGRELEELDTVWVSDSGDFADTAAFAAPQWVMAGMERPRQSYGLDKRQRARENLARYARLAPAPASRRAAAFAWLCAL